MPRKTLSPEVEANLRELEAMGDEGIDLSDIPEVTDFRGFGYADFELPMSRAKPVWIDRELLGWIVENGDQDAPVARRVNDALREYVAKAMRKAA